MCGVAGILGRADPIDARVAVVEAMLARLTHRGPDGAGTWSDDRAGLTLGHRRLAVVDLTDAASQPMASADGRWVLSFNGELYGFRALRDELVRSGCQLRSSGDTEVLVELIARHGVVAALARLNAMYAVSVWDRERQELWLARDPIGEKPLHVARTGRSLTWASELGALTAVDGFDDEIAHDALATYLQLGYVPAPMTIYVGAEKLRPGEWRRYDRNGTLVSGGTTRPATTTGSGALDDDELVALLADAVAIRTVADVPVGVFLSGGIDSTIVAALAARHAPTTTFTAAFTATSHDESDHARAVATAIGAEHVQLEVSAADALDLAHRLPALYGEPFGDPSAIPTHLIAAAARSRVTVALTGDGGDELFGGYNRLVAGMRLERLRRALPPRARSVLGAALTGVPTAALTRVGGPAGRLAGEGAVPNVADKLHKAAATLAADDIAAAITSLVAVWPDPGQLLPGARPRDLAVGGGAFGDELLALDRRLTLPEQMLTKVDRASMATSLEARPALLDPRVVAYAQHLPLAAHVEGRVGKQQLRRIVGRLVDPSLLDRPKMGFDPPIGAWLRGPLRTWAEELLGPSALRASGISAVEPVRRSLERHQRGAGNEEYRLWTVLQYQLWFDSVHGARSNPRPAVRPARVGSTTGGALVIRPFEERDRSTVDRLLARSMKRTDDHDRFARLLVWKHEANPFGRSPAWVAVDDGQVIGYRAFMRWEFEGQGRTWRAVRAVDTATDPDHQGRGIFRLMTLEGLHHLAADGVEFVFNTPNDQSRPGYLQMGWQLVGRLDPRIRPSRLGALPALARSREAAGHWGEPVDVGLAPAEAFADDDAVERLLASCPAAPDLLRTRRTPAYLRWRYDGDLLGYRVLLLGDRLEDGACCFRVRRRGASTEATIGELLVPGGRRAGRRELLGEVVGRTGVDYALLIGGGVGDGTVPVPRSGPTLVWRDLVADRKPALDEWGLTMGDVELF